MVAHFSVFKTDLFQQNINIKALQIAIQMVHIFLTFYTLLLSSSFFSFLLEAMCLCHFDIVNQRGFDNRCLGQLCCLISLFWRRRSCLSGIGKKCKVHQMESFCCSACARPSILHLKHMPSGSCFKHVKDGGGHSSRCCHLHVVKMEQAGTSYLPKPIWHQRHVKWHRRDMQMCHEKGPINLR